MKKVLTFILIAVTAGVLPANTNFETTRTSSIYSVLDRQENRINRAFYLRYISYIEYENLYYQLEDIEAYQYRASIDRRIDYREERILSELIYNLESNLDQILIRRSFCANYYRPVYLKRNYYSDHYHHYRQPRVSFNVSFNTSNHNRPRSNSYNYRDQYDRRDNQTYYDNNNRRDNDRGTNRSYNGNRYNNVKNKNYSNYTKPRSSSSNSQTIKTRDSNGRNRTIEGKTRVYKNSSNGTTNRYKVNSNKTVATTKYQKSTPIKKITDTKKRYYR